jgi:hypothetical protein
MITGISGGFQKSRCAGQWKEIECGELKRKEPKGTQRKTGGRRQTTGSRGQRSEISKNTGAKTEIREQKAIDSDDTVISEQ